MINHKRHKTKKIGTKLGKKNLYLKFARGLRGDMVLWQFKQQLEDCGKNLNFQHLYSKTHSEVTLKKFK
jgi:hypothetical protein